jgi:NADH-quinone oxidoreductase subunit H
MSGATVGPIVGLVAVAAVLAVGVYVVALLEAAIGEVVAGRRRALREVAAAPVRRAALAIVSGTGRTERPDLPGWVVAPALLMGLAAVALGTVPFGPGFSVADPATGFVLFSAAIALVMIAVYLHGWSPNSLWPLHGAYRFAAEALSFQMPFLLAMLATTLPAESLQIRAIVEAQEGLWNVVRQPLGLPLYLVVAAGAAFWGPLGLPDADDLAGGTAAEAGGADRLLWQAARAAMLVAVAAMGATAFLGGWWGPVLPGPLWVVVKTLLLLVVLVAGGHLLARVRIQRFVVACWVVLLPLALVNIFVAGAWLL